MSLVERPTLRFDAPGDKNAGGTRARSAQLCALVALVLTSGCSLALNTDRHQCAQPADCAKVLGGEASSYMCTENLCRAVVECVSNEQCTTAGRGVCSAGTCVGCVASTDCDSPTAQCVSNVCQDPSWGCLTEVDNRPAAVQASATLTVKVTNAVTMQPMPAVTVHPCLDAVVDPNCAATYPNSSSTYDAATGTATILGLQNGFPIHVEFLSGAPGDFMPLQYYTNRAARDSETVADLAMVPPTILTMLPTPVPFDVKKGLITVRIHDCQGMPGSKLTVSMLKPPPDLITTYLSEAGAPRFDLTATTSVGAAGFLNVTPGSLATIVVNISATKTLTYQFAPIGGATSIIDLYPRVPATK